MFKGFNLNLNSSSIDISNSTKLEHQKFLAAEENKFRKNLTDLILSNHAIDGEKLKNLWFPNVDNAHVFISHAHKDKKLAENFAAWLYAEFGIYSFIDSHVWGYANNLLRTIDDKFARPDLKSNYFYNVRNETTSHVHMMLSCAINEVMDNAECLFFMNTENAINNISLSNEPDDHRTASPWIMSELATSKIIRKKQNVTRYILQEKARAEPAFESIGSQYYRVPIQHKAHVGHLIEIGNDHLMKWEHECPLLHKGYDALTVLYNLHAKCNFSLDRPSRPLRRRKI